MAESSGFLSKALQKRHMYIFNQDDLLPFPTGVSVLMYSARRKQSGKVIRGVLQ